MSPTLQGSAWLDSLCVVWIGEASRLEIVGLNLDLKCLLRFQVARLSVLRESDDLRDHFGRTRNVSHNNAVTRTTLDLQTVGQCFTRTEVDEICGISGGSCLSLF